MIKLSIIIPCYNCEKTLESAVASVYRQEPLVPFDVTMVDDSSTDGTHKCMESLAKKYPDIKLVGHASNRGGGATRNTAVANSDGKIIFCLDSDDMLGPDFLRNMTRFWLEKRCDGVGISTSIKFRKSDIHDVAYTTEFEGPGEKVRFESLLNSSTCSLFSTFLLTRDAFFRIGGYPTDHGFDTQGMAFRFMCNGLTAYTCPDTVYYHRVDFHESYYVREDRAGRSHWNMFKIFNEFLYLFRDEIKAKILEYDVFPTQAQRLLQDEIRDADQQKSVYREDYQDLVHLGRDRVADRLKTSENKYDQYWVGTYLLSKGLYADAIDAFSSALKSGFKHRMIYPAMLEAALKISGNAAPASISLRDLTYFVNDPARQAESAAPPLSRYQRFENQLARQGILSVAARLLKSLRLSLRRFRRRTPC